MIYHSAWSLVWFTLHPSKRNWNKNSAFPFLLFPAIFCHPLEGKACHEATAGLHSITDGRIKPCCLGGWYMAAQLELNVSFLSSYPIQRGLWIFLSYRRAQGAKGENSLSLCTNLCSGLATKDLLWFSWECNKDYSTRQITHCLTFGNL